MYSRSCGMESCTHILQFALLCVDLLSGLAAVSVSCRASWPYLFDSLVWLVVYKQIQERNNTVGFLFVCLPTAYGPSFGHMLNIT